MRLAAMITRTPAQICSVAAALQSLCPALPTTRNPKAAPLPRGSSSSSSLHLTASKTKVPTNTRQATAGTANLSGLSCWAERRVKGAPQPHLETGPSGAPTRGSLEATKAHTGQRLVSKGSASKTSTAAHAARLLPWARVAKDKGRAPSQPPCKADAVKSQVLTPTQAAVALPQGAARPAASSRIHLPTEQVQALSQPHLATCPTKAPSLAHLVTCLTRTQSQAQLRAETAGRLHVAQPSSDLGSKAQSHSMLTRPKESTPHCQLPGTLGSGSRVKPDHRPGKTTQGTHPAAILEPQGMLVPLLTAATATHSSCSVESWGDSNATQAQGPTPCQAAPGQEGMLASQITALCTELVTALGSQEDLHVLLAKALSQGEVWATLTQVLSKEAQGTTMAKALPQGMLGLALAKALSWGELGTTLSRALSRGELCTELAKAVQGRVAEVLSRALTQDEWAVLGRALSQGELGAVLCQSLSRAVPRAGAVLPKATSTVTSSKLLLPPAPAQVTVWGPCRRAHVQPEPSKVGIWGCSAAGLWGDRGDGAALEGSPCLSRFSVATASSVRVITQEGPCPLISGQGLLLSCWAGLGRVFSDPYLSPRIRRENVCSTPGTGKLACDASPAVGGNSPLLPRPCPRQPPLGPWQPFVTTGVSPSTSRPSVTCGPVQSAQQPRVVSRVAPCSGMLLGEGSVAPGRLSGSVRAGRGTPSQPSTPAGQGTACWCQSVGASTVTPHPHCSTMATGPRQPSRLPRGNPKSVHPQNSKGTSKAMNKETPSAPKVAVMGKGQAPRGQGGECAAHSSKSARVLWLCPNTSNQQEKDLSQGLASNRPASSEPATGLTAPPLGGLVARGPSMLAHSTAQGSKPQSSGSSTSYSSSGLSTGSVGGVAAIEVLDHPREGSWEEEPPLKALLSWEPVRCPQKLQAPEKVGGTSQRSQSLRPPCPAPVAHKRKPTLSHTLASSCLAVSVHWVAEDQKDQNSVKVSKRTAQGTSQSGPRRTRSLSSGIPAVGLQTPEAPTFSHPLSQPLLASRAAPSLGPSSGAAGGCPDSSQLSPPTGLTPYLSQPTLSSRVSPGVGHPSAASGMVPGPVQTVTSGALAASSACVSAADGLGPMQAGLPGTRGASPGLGGPPPLPSKACPGSHQPSGVSRVNPSLPLPSMASGGSPSFSQSLKASDVSTSLGQPLLSCKMTFRQARARPSPAARMSPYLSQPRVANPGSPSLAQQPVAWGGGQGFSPPPPSSMGSSDLAGSGVHVTEPGQCPPSILVPAGFPSSYPSVAIRSGQGLDQAPLGSGMGPRDDPMVTGMVSSLQNTELEFYQPPEIYGGPPSMATVPTPHLYQACEAHEENPGVSQCPWFKGVAASTLQAHQAAGAFLNLSPGATSWPCTNASVPQSQSPVADGAAALASRALETGAPLKPQGSLGTSGLAQGLPPLVVLQRHRTNQAPLEPSVYQASVPLPVTPYHQPGMAPIVPSNYHYMGIAHVPEMGRAAGGLVLGCEDRLTMGTVVPDTSGLAFRFPPGSVMRRMGQSLPQGSVMAGVAQGLPPRSVMDGVPQGLPAGSLMDGVAQGFSPGYMMAGVAQGLPPRSVVDGTVHSLPPGSLMDGMVQGLPAGSLMDGVAQGLPLRSMMAEVAQGFSPGSVMDGMVQGLPPGSMVVSGVAPSRGAAPDLSRGKPCLSVGPLEGFLAPRLPPASEAPLGSMPVCGDSKASPGSLVVGLFPRPFLRGLDGNAPGGPSQDSGAAGLAQAHPLAQVANRAAGGCRVPEALSRAPQFGQDPGRKSEALGDQAILRPGVTWDTVSQAWGSSREPSPSRLVETTAWMQDSAPRAGVTYDRRPLCVERSLPKDQKPLCRKMAPGQACGLAPVPGQAPVLARSLVTSDTTPVLQPTSVGSWGPPGACLEAASWVPGVQAGSGADGALWQPLAPGTTEGPLAFQPESMALPGVRCYSQGTAAANAVSQLSQMAPGSLPLGSVARMGSPSPPLRSAAAGVGPQVQPHGPKPPSPALPQGQVASCAPWKPTSRARGSSPPFPSTRKSFPSRGGSLAPELLEGSAVKLGPPQRAQVPSPRSSPCGCRHTTGQLSTDVAQDIGVPRLSPGGRQASLGSESSLTEPQCPLSDQAAQHFTGPTAHHKPSLPPGVPQGSLPQHFAAPTMSHHKPSLTAGVPQGPVDASTRGDRPRTSAVPSGAVRPLDRAVAPHTPRQPARVPGPWAHVGPMAVSVQHVEKIFVWAATVIQACARGYLVRRIIKVWHQRATVIQATWRGHCVRRNLAQLYRATTVIQAAWRGHCIRQARAQHMQLLPAWTEPGGAAQAATEHRCFQSCQPHACGLCRSLSPGLGSPPSVVMLVGASPRTCHTCGHTRPTRVVHGTGRACASRPAPQRPQQPRDVAATVIQSAWRGFKARRQLKEQHSAARLLQATWRGHYTRSCLNPEALLGTASPWDTPQHGSWQPSRRPGV